MNHKSVDPTIPTADILTNLLTLVPASKEPDYPMVLSLRSCEIPFSFIATIPLLSPFLGQDSLGLFLLQPGQFNSYNIKHLIM